MDADRLKPPLTRGVGGFLQTGNFKSNQYKGLDSNQASFVKPFSTDPVPALKFSAAGMKKMTLFKYDHSLKKYCMSAIS